MDAATFIVRRPEFAQVDVRFINAALVDALTQIDPVVYGTQTDQAQMWLAADLLTSSPYGGATRLEQGQGESEYRKQFERVREALCVGFALGGVFP